MNKAILCLVFGITLLVTMGISSILPVLPLLAETFGIPLQSSWRIIAAFALPGLLCVPFVGVLADRYGRKAILIPALILFAIGGAGCMAVTTYHQLLLCRMIQGAGSSALGLLYATIIADTWEGDRRIRAMSLNAMVLGLGTAISPAIGGALAMVSWRLPFLMPLPALALAWLAYRLPLMKPTRNISLLSYAQECIACVTKRQTLVLLGLTLLTFTMLSGPLITCFPMLAESVFKATPLEIGLIIGTASLTAGLAASGLPLLYRRFSARTLLLSAMVLYCIAFMIMGRAPSLLWLVPGTMMYGFGQGLNIPLVSTLLAGQAGDEQRGALMAVNAVLLRMGQNIGPAAFGTLAGWLGPADAILAGSVVALAMAVIAGISTLPEISGTEERPPVDSPVG